MLSSNKSSASASVRPSSNSSERSCYVGVDIAKLTFDASIASLDVRTSEWSKLPVQTFEMSIKGIEALASWLEKELKGAQVLCIVVESTGCYSRRFFHNALKLDLPPVAIVNPYYPLAFRRSLGIKDKSDRVDARMLALYGVVHKPEPTKAPSPAYERLRILTRLHDDYEKVILSWKNRLEQVDDPGAIETITCTIAQLTESADQVRCEIERLIEENEEMKADVALMTSIPGIGKKTASLILAELGDLREWKRDEIVSFCGLYPREYSSGTSVRKKARFSGGGGSRIRRALFMCACSLRRYKSRISDFGIRLNERGKCNMCAVGAMMRKLLLTARAVVVSGKPYDPNFSPISP